MSVSVAGAFGRSPGDDASSAESDRALHGERRPWTMRLDPQSFNRLARNDELSDRAITTPISG